MSNFTQQYTVYRFIDKGDGFITYVKNTRDFSHEMN